MSEAIPEETINRLKYFGGILLVVFGIISFIYAFFFPWYGWFASTIFYIIGGIYQLGLGLYVMSVEGYLKKPLMKGRKLTEIEMIILGAIAAFFGHGVLWGLGSLGGVLLVIAGALIFYKKIMVTGPPEVVTTEAPEIKVEEEKEKAEEEEKPEETKPEEAGE